MRAFKWTAIAVAGIVGLLAAALAGAIAFGGPAEPPPLATVRDAIIARQRGDLPTALSFAARDGTALAYRRYAASPGGAGAAILIHGSVGSGADMHEVAKALAAAGVAAYVPDIRGHGSSGRRGDIDRIGQLEDDLADLLDRLDRDGAPPRRVLIGHSSGGGFALRVAASRLGGRFVGAILLAPFLGPGAPTNRGGGGWVAVGAPRIVGLTILNRLGITVLNGLPAIAFAVDPHGAADLTPQYSFRLMANFAPHRDWRRDIADARGPLAVLVGGADQLFQADRFAEAFAGAPHGRVEILPGIDHMGITAAPAALHAIVATSRRLLAGP